jgi:hypothetical protein
MRHILFDNARRKQAVSYGGGLHRTQRQPDEFPIARGVPDGELLAVQEAAAALGLSERMAKRDWAYARAWLYREVVRRRSKVKALS